MKQWKITNNSAYSVNLHIGADKAIHFESGEVIVTENEALMKHCKGFAFRKQFIIEEVTE